MEGDVTLSRPGAPVADLSWAGPLEGKLPIDKGSGILLLRSKRWRQIPFGLVI
jgi:hypothetical protein